MGGPKTQLKVTKITMHHQAPPTLGGSRGVAPVPPANCATSRRIFAANLQLTFGFIWTGEQPEKRRRQSRWCCQDS